MRLIREDLARDQQIELTKIGCPFSGSDADLIAVFSGGANMHKADTWELAVDSRDDFWVFDTGGDGRADLVIVFGRGNGALHMGLYDGQYGDAEVSFRLQDGLFAILERHDSTIRVLAPLGQPAGGRWRAR